MQQLGCSQWSLRSNKSLDIARWKLYIRLNTSCQQPARFEVGHLRYSRVEVTTVSFMFTCYVPATPPTNCNEFLFSFLLDLPLFLLKHSNIFLQLEWNLHVTPCRSSTAGKSEKREKWGTSLPLPHLSFQCYFYLPGSNLSSRHGGPSQHGVPAFPQCYS